MVARIAADAVLVADHTVVGTQFQVGQPGSIRGPRFGRDTPSAAYAPEYAPTVVVVTEFRRTVGTNGACYIILVVVVVVRTQEITLQCFLIFTSTNTGESSSRVGENIVGERIEALDQAVSGLVVQRRGTHPVELMADQGVYVVFSVIVRPVQRLLAVDVLVVGIRPSESAFFADACAVQFADVAVTHRPGVVDGQVSLECEVFEELGFHISAHVQVVVDRFVLIVFQLVFQVVC